jgi:hypothetical protein
MWAGGLQDHNRITLVCWPLTASRYSVALTYCPLTMDSYSAGRPDNPASCHTCTRRGEMIGRDGLYTVEDIICYTRQVEPGYMRIRPPQGHLSGPGSHCACHSLELLKATQTLESLERSQRLNKTLQHNSHSPVDVGYYALAARTN